MPPRDRSGKAFFRKVTVPNKGLATAKFTENRVSGSISRRVVVSVLAGLAVLSLALMGQELPPSPPILMDGHVHIINRVYGEGIDPWVPQSALPFNYALARQGGANVVIENITGHGYQNYNGTVKQVARNIEAFHRVLDGNRDKMELALSAPDVRRIIASGKLAVVLGIEGGFDQEGDVDVLRLWYRLGVRLIQFPGMVTTAYGDAAIRGGNKWNGINDRGRRLVEEMNRLGILIDITHASEAAQRQIVEASRAPVVASHVAMRAICSNPANMPDDIVRAVAEKGGLVGIHSAAVNIGQRYFEYSQTHTVGAAPIGAMLDAADKDPRLVRPPNPADSAYIDSLDQRLGDLWRRFHAQAWREDAAAEPLVPTMEEWADHVAHAVEVAGASHVGIGLDLTYGRSTLRGFDARGYSRLAEVLRRRNLPSQILGENWLRVLDAARVP